MKKLLIAAMAVSAVAANAQILYEQTHGTFTDSVISMEFTDVPAASTYLFDDLSNAVVWTITDVVIQGAQTGTLTLTSFHLRFQQNASFTNPGTIGLAFDTNDPATYNAQNLNFDLGAGMDLLPGNWFISAWVTGTFAPNNTQWNWDCTEVITGDDAWVHNPGGGLGLIGGTNPHHIAGNSQPPFPEVDLVFSVSGTAVPEPGTFIAIGIGLAGLAIARRRK
ncbi:MAG: PEP-CTERM sorting domain-containing protein [Armatimonadota bacterium]|nr:PEP-CTERM sorting domain-containing protein [Armatimonadota bacterium]